MADKKEPLHKKRYASTPRLERDKESGSMAVKKPEKKAEAKAAGAPDGEKHGLEMTQRQAIERLDLHHKHEREHAELAQKYTADAPKGEEGGGEAKAEPKAAAEKKDDAPKETKKDDKE